MAILDTNNNISAIEERRIRIIARRVYDSAVNQYEAALRSFWQNPSLTPQQMSDALGTDAADYFMFYNKLRLYILEVNPTAQITDVSAYGTFTINGNGTVTINSVG